jgi:hypothetical protein
VAAEDDAGLFFLFGCGGLGKGERRVSGGCVEGERAELESMV